MTYKSVRTATIAMCFVGMLATSARAQEPDAEFRADIERLMEVTGAAAMGTQMATLVTDSMFKGMKQAQPGIPDRALTILKEVMDPEFSKMFTGPDSVMPAFVDLYAKTFTRDDVLALLEFYRSPTGRKAIQVLPQLTRDSAAIGEKWAATNMPRIIALVEERLRAEGFLK